MFKTDDLGPIKLITFVSASSPLPSMTNLLQPADVGWMEKTAKRFGKIRSPSYALAVTWIGEIWEQFPRERIVASFKHCGITGTRKPHELHSALQSK